MKLNTNKTNTMIVSRSRTIHLQSIPLTQDGTLMEESADDVMLGVTLDAKMTFEKHLSIFFQSYSSKAWYFMIDSSF